MTRIIAALILLFSFGIISLNGQDNVSEVKSVIQQLFDGMRANDSTMVKDLFSKGSSLSSIFTNKEGEVIKRSSSSEGFITAIGRPRTQVWDEQIWSYEVKIDGPMANVWTEYTFYLDDKMSHCGVNVFEMIHLREGWKISGITDTRRTTECQTISNAAVNNLIDNWHKAAAEADETTFFGSMTEDGVYIGTDASERWIRDEMKVWSEKFFQQESAWSFTPISRNVTFDQTETIGWFDELLDTWMGTCRSSGVVVKTDAGWKIKHYHLSIAVPNDKVDGYLEIIGKSRK